MKHKPRHPDVSYRRAEDFLRGRQPPPDYCAARYFSTSSACFSVEALRSLQTSLPSLKRNAWRFAKPRVLGTPKASTTLPSASASSSNGSLYLSLKAFWASALSSADSEDFHALVGERRVGVAQAARLLGAAGGVGLRVKINERVALGGGFRSFTTFPSWSFCSTAGIGGSHGEGLGQRVAGENAGGHGGEDLGDFLHLGESYTLFRIRNRRMCQAPVKPARGDLRQGGKLCLESIPGVQSMMSPEHA